MDATKLLIRQHEEVEGLFNRIQKSTGRQAATLIDALARNLLAHMLIEQNVFYPAAAEAERDLVHESYAEHALARRGLEAVLRCDPEDETFPAKVTVLKEVVLHHVEEEQEQLFPKIRRVLDSNRLEMLGQQMEELFEGLVEQQVVVLARHADSAAELEQVSEEMPTPQKREQPKQKRKARAVRRKAAPRARGQARQTRQTRGASRGQGRQQQQRKRAR